jgi:hypothetical protein
MSGAGPRYTRLATDNKSKSYRKAVDLIFAALSTNRRAWPGSVNQLTRGERLTNQFIIE